MKQKNAKKLLETGQKWAIQKKTLRVFKTILKHTYSNNDNRPSMTGIYACKILLLLKVAGIRINNTPYNN